MNTPIETTILVEIRESYGARRAYPANEQAQRLARLVGAKTLTRATLDAARDMGFRVAHHVAGYRLESTLDTSILTA